MCGARLTLFVLGARESFQTLKTLPRRSEMSPRRRKTLPSRHPLEARGRDPKAPSRRPNKAPGCLLDVQALNNMLGDILSPMTTIRMFGLVSKSQRTKLFVNTMTCLYSPNGPGRASRTSRTMAPSSPSPSFQSQIPDICSLHPCGPKPSFRNFKDHSPKSPQAPPAPLTTDRRPGPVSQPGPPPPAPEPPQHFAAGGPGARTPLGEKN